MSGFVRDAARSAVIFAAILLCLYYSRVMLAGYISLGRFGNDFGVYWRTANLPVEAAYRWPGRYPFPYAPTMLLWISPLSLIPKWPAYFVFVACSLTAFVLACRPYLTRPAIALALIPAPFMRGIFTGQVCAILAALLLWTCGTANRIAAGVALGLIASIKPQLVIMAPLMLALNRDWRAFVGAGAMFLGSVLLSIVVFGPERWPEWIASMDHFHGAVVNNGIIGIGVTRRWWR